MQVQDILISLPILTVLSSVADAWSPTNGYAPGNVSCEKDIKLIRKADGLSKNETEWLKKRNAVTKDALKDFLTRGTANFSDSSLLNKLFDAGNGTNVPKIGIAASGGGYRAMLVSAGMVAAMDNRTDGANENGLGGLLQSSTYLAGLSGGNWMTTTLAWNNWTSIQEILNNLSDTNTSSIWNIENSILSPGGDNKTATNELFADIKKQIEKKTGAGFNGTLVDVWGRALSYYMFPSLANGGEGLTWSTLRDAEVFKNGEMPFPISVTDGKYPGSVVVNSNATVFEVNPFELGSWDPSLNAFTDVKYLGTEVSNGSPTTEGQCISGFDNTGFIMGTSADIFNLVAGSSYGAVFSGIIDNFTKQFLPNITGDYTDVGVYAPNPFKDSDTVNQNYSTALAKADSLYLVDGGEDGEVIPFIPLLQKDRDLDVVFALDVTDDTDESWPNGNSMIKTYERQFFPQGEKIAFPYVPDTETFINSGLNKRPTFFGCDAQNLTDLAYIPPLVVYIPNTEYSFASNTSTYQLNYDLDDRISMIQNGYEAMTMGNFTKDPDFLGCISCAIMRRKQESLNATLPDECSKCFSTYCWDDKSVSSNTTSVNSTSFNSTAQSFQNTTLTSATATMTTSGQTVSSSANTSSSSASSSNSEGNAAANNINLKTTIGGMVIANVIFNLL